MKLKPSEYNFIYDDLGQDQIVFYNSFSGALAVVKDDQYHQFNDYVEYGTEIRDKDFYKNLLSCGYLIPEKVDEHFLIKTRLQAGRYQRNSLSLTIAPTMACNFRCVYCFEQGHYGHHLMTEEVQEKLFEFVKKRLKDVKNIRITWFGGEPLIAMSVIEHLSEKFINLCNERDIQYKASIITNGYLLTPEITNKLKKLHVEYIQVTLDGPKEIHDARRPLTSGKGTYDVIIKNLLTVQGILPISLRINVDHNNIGAADEVIKVLSALDLTHSIYPYLGQVVSDEAESERENCFTDEIYSKETLHFLMRHGFSLQSSFPLPKSVCCGADLNSAWIIDDEGYLYKCWDDIGVIEHSVGNICYNHFSVSDTSLVSKYASFDPTQETECFHCKLLPVCLGGCPHKRLYGGRRCEKWKFCMQDYILACARRILEKRSPTAVSSEVSS